MSDEGMAIAEVVRGWAAFVLCLFLLITGLIARVQDWPMASDVSLKAVRMVPPRIKRVAVSQACGSSDITGSYS